jgi:hypothetical protein
VIVMILGLNMILGPNNSNGPNRRIHNHYFSYVHS